MSVEEIYGKCTLLAAPQAPGSWSRGPGNGRWISKFKIPLGSFFFYLPHRGVPQVPGASDLQVRSSHFLVNLVELGGLTKVLGVYGGQRRPGINWEAPKETA